MPDTFVTPMTPEQKTPPAPTEPPTSRLTRFLMVLAGVLIGMLLSVLAGGLLAGVIVDLGSRIFEVVSGNPAVFGMVAIMVIIGAIIGGWVAYSLQDDTPVTLADLRNVDGAKASIPSAMQPAPLTAPKSPIEAVLQGLRDVFTAFLRACKALFMLFANTLLTLLPSTAFTTQTDRTYSSDMIKTYQAAIQVLPLKTDYRDIILNNWLGQVSWADDRATRERNVNEIIRWWQILLGVLIPALTTASQNVAVGLMGIFVAFLTAIAQFRRPDENWRHYRILSENYQNEIWDFTRCTGINTSANPNKPLPVPMTYDEAFPVFHQQMTKMRRDDVNTYFKDTASASRPRNVEELRKEFADLQQLFAITGQSTPAANIQISTDKPGQASIVTESVAKTETTVTGDTGSAG